MVKKKCLYYIISCLFLFFFILYKVQEFTYNVVYCKIWKFVNFASQLRCHCQKVGLQFLVHEEKLVLISILLLLRCKDNILMPFIREDNELNLRNQTEFRNPFTRLQLFASSFFPSTIKSWNKLSPQLRLLRCKDNILIYNELHLQMHTHIYSLDH
jgi:hypothetical protein